MTALVLTGCVSSLERESLAAWTPEGLFESQVRWIMYPEQDMTADKKHPRRLESPDFACAKPVQSARFLCFADCNLNDVKWNGASLPLKKPEQPLTFLFDIAPESFAEHNRLQIFLDGGNGPCAVIGRLEVTYADGTTGNLFTNGDWTGVPLDAPEAAPLPVAVMGDYLSRYNVSYYAKPVAHFPELLTTEETKQLEAQRERIKAERQTALEKLSKESLETVSTVYHNSHPMIKIGDKLHRPFLYSSTVTYGEVDRAAFRRKLASFSAGGVHLYCVSANLQEAWKADGSVDAEHVIREILDVLRADPEAHFMIGTGYSLPEWWLDAHPDELIDYANGGINPKTHSHIERLRAPSFASKVWRKEFPEAVAKLISQLEASPVGRRIFAYRVDHGVYYEWHCYGMAEGMPDTGKAMTAAFRSHLKRKYGTDQALRQAWDDNDVTLATALVPGKDARLVFSAGDLRDPVKERPVIDFLDCLGEEQRDLLLASDRAAKEACDFRALVGNYASYFWTMEYSAEGWHLKADEIIGSEYVDFQCSPPSYADEIRGIGGPAAPRTNPCTFSLRGKFCILESDSRTHLTAPSYYTYTTNGADDAELFTRDFLADFSLNVGMWFMDFGQDWYDSPELLNRLAKLSRLSQMDYDTASVAEVAMVVDYDSVPFHSTYINTPIARKSIMPFNYELSMAGVPYDSLIFQDLARENCPKYKVYFFPNLFYVTPEKAAVIQRLKAQGATCVWSFAPGYLRPQGADVQGIRQLTGISCRILEGARSRVVRMKNGYVMDIGDNTNRTLLPEEKNGTYDPSLSPCFVIDDPDAKSLATCEINGETYTQIALKKQGDATDIYLANGYIDHTVWHDLCRRLGIHCYLDTLEDAVFVNRSAVGIHTGSAGEKTIRLPKKAARIRQILPEEKELPAGDTIRFTATRRGESRLFRVELED